MYLNLLEKTEELAPFFQQHDGWKVKIQHATIQWKYKIDVSFSKQHMITPLILVSKALKKSKVNALTKCIDT